MKNWLKFFPADLRDSARPKEIRGPYFPGFRKNTWFLGDCLFRFGAPLSNPVFGTTGRTRFAGGISPGNKDILKAEWEEIYSGTPGAPPIEWGLQSFYANTWYFVGPWFTGVKASLTASAWMATAKIKNNFDGKHLFHPRVFESAVTSYLDSRYGYEKNGRWPMYRGPLNWSVLSISAKIKAVVCDIHQIGNGAKDNPCLNRLVFFPISPSQFIEIYFDFGGVEINRDPVRAKPLFKLCDDIISTFRLEVGESTQSEWNRVQATCPDMSITETMEEFPWPLKIPKKSSTPKEMDITPQQKAIE